MNRRLKKRLQNLGGALLLVLAPLVLLELLLTVVDPWGLRYFNDLLTIGNELFQPDNTRDYIMQDGTHQLSYWQVTIDDSTRLIPANHPDAACTVVLLGDSVIFGYGVDDVQTTANYLAEQFPNVDFINTGMVAYNSTNVLHNYQAFPAADGYLYLIVGNDHDPAIATEGEVFVSSGNERLPMLVRYVNFAIYRNENKVDLVNDPHTEQIDTPNMQRFLADVDNLADDERIYLVTFDFYETLITLITERGHVVDAVPYPPQTISIVDAHLNPAGSQALANDLAPVVQRIIIEQCGDE